MKNEYLESVAAYRRALLLAKSMKVRGIISEEEYDKIDTIMAEKYGISLVSIFR